MDPAATIPPPVPRTRVVDSARGPRDHGRSPATGSGSAVLAVFVSVLISAVLSTQAVFARPGQGSLFDRPTENVTPSEIAGQEVVERLGDSVPRDLAFTDQDGRPVVLGRFFSDGKGGKDAGGADAVPVILTFNYSSCPTLCQVQLSGLVDGLKGLGWTPGKEFRIVTIGLDPLELPSRAHQSRNKFVNDYGRKEAAAGWHFLVGNGQKAANIRKAAESVGYPYRRVEDRNEYVHPGVVVVLTPDGRIARYLYGKGGVEFPSGHIKLALIEAADGKIGSPTDRALLNELVLWCFHYDPAGKGYTLAAYRLLQAAAVLMLLVMGIGFWMLKRRERRRRAAGQSDTRPAATAEDAAGIGPAPVQTGST